MKLIGMTDFVLEQKDSYYNQRFFKIEKYANFLKQPLELWMFVPCDEDDKIMSEPNDYMADKGYFDKYQQAKERCLFKGFEYCESQSMGIDLRLNLFISPYSKNRIYLTKKEKTGFHSWFELYTIENLVQCELTLTKTAEKLIGL